MFWKLDLFLSLGEGRETPALLRLLERAKLNHWSAGFHKVLGDYAVAAQLVVSQSVFSSTELVRQSAMIRQCCRAVV
jgi:hypothetical protein